MSYAESTVLDPANGDGHRYVVDDLHGAHQQRVGLDAELGLADIGFEGQSSGVAEILSGRAPTLKRAKLAVRSWRPLTPYRTSAHRTPRPSSTGRLPTCAASPRRSRGAKRDIARPGSNRQSMALSRAGSPPTRHLRKGVTPLTTRAIQRPTRAGVFRPIDRVQRRSPPSTAFRRSIEGWVTSRWSAASGR